MQPAVIHNEASSAREVADGDARARPTHGWLWWGLFSPPLLFGHLLLGADAYSATVCVLAGIVGALALTTVVGASPTRLPFVMTFAVVAYMHYGAQSLREVELIGIYGPIYLSDEAFVSAMSACALGLVILISVATFVRRLDHSRHLVRGLAAVSPGDDALHPPGTLLALLTAVSLVGTFVVLVRSHWIPASLRFPVSLLVTPAMYQTLIFVAMQRSGSNKTRALFWGFTACVSATGAMTGMLGQVAMPWVVAVVLLYVRSGRVPMGLLAAGTLAFLVLNPAKHVYRAQIWEEAGGAASLTERAGAWANALETTWLGGGADDDMQANLEASANRVSSLQYAAQTFEWVPALVPYAGLARWKAIPESFIPRFLWPNKLDLTEEFADRYNFAFGLQTERGAQSTTLAVSLISDAYWGAGWPGVIAAFALVGCLLGIYEGAMSPSHTGTLVVGMLFLSSFSPSTHLAHMVTGVPQKLIVGISLLWGVALLNRLARSS